MLGNVEGGGADIDAAKRIKPDIAQLAVTFGLSLDSRGR
jgi:hypothetical protein